MKAIIKGIAYDTDTATALADRTDYAEEDPRYYTEKLFQTPDGNYFLHGFGGRDSWYHKTNEQGKRDKGENIIPLSADQAEAWKKHEFEFTEIF